jgi:hypothetical protein
MAWSEAAQAEASATFAAAELTPLVTVVNEVNVADNEQKSRGIFISSGLEFG